jgi:hypothetical protein
MEMRATDEQLGKPNPGARNEADVSMLMSLTPNLPREGGRPDSV